MVLALSPRHIARNCIHSSNCALYISVQAAIAGESNLFWVSKEGGGGGTLMMLSLTLAKSVRTAQSSQMMALLL